MGEVGQSESSEGGRSYWHKRLGGVQEGFTCEMEVETLSETGSLWGRVLDTKYGEFTRDYETRVVGGGSLWWRDLQIICAGETDWFK